MGRNKKPTAIKEFEGNPGKRPLNKESEPKPLNTMPACPDFLDKIAKGAWRRLAPEMHRIGVLTIVDRDALAAYCSAYSRWRAAEDALKEKDGLVFVINDKHGKSRYQQQHPEIGIASKAMQDMHKFMKEFGLTPSARSNLVTALDEGEENPWAEYLAAN